MKSSNSQIQKGFTLIEALIAFVVLSVGLLGALLFHSTVLKESSLSKAQIEAAKIAERLIESERAKVFSSEADMLAALPVGVQSGAQGTNAEYIPTWSSPVAVSGAAGVYQQTLTLVWSGGSTSLSTFFSWIDASKTLTADDAGTGAGSEYAGEIPLPTGTLTAIERLEVVDAESAEFDAGKDVREGVRQYTDSEGKEVIAVEVADGTYVRLAELSESDNEIMMISGKIYNNWANESRRVNLKFRPVYKDKDGTYYDKIIDIRATGGANCVIGKYSNDSEDRGLEATYLCVAGTGWNGSIYPYYRVLDGTSLKQIDIQEVQGVSAKVCAPRQRSYRYYTLTIANADKLNELSQIISNGSMGTVSSAQDIIDNLGASLAGQSGLVRFYPTASEAQASSEGVYWGDYFWHNPDYIVSPALQSSDIRLASGATTAFEGYEVPLFSSSATASYSTNYPGDVAYQNFYLAVPTVKTGNTSVTWSCDEVVSQALASFASGASLSHTNHSYLLKYGLPGYESNGGATVERGYIPSIPASNAFDVKDYNDFAWAETTKNGVTTYTPDFRGSIILGYTLATKSISGKLIYPTEMSSGTFEMAGNPEPVVSIQCNISSSQTVTASGYERSYSCGVPANWSGNILAYYKPSPSGNLESCDRVTLSQPVSTAVIPDGLTDTIRSYLSVSTAWPGVIYFVSNEISSAAVPTIDTNTLKLLGIKSFSRVNESLIDENFTFNDPAVNTPACL